MAGWASELAHHNSAEQIALHYAVPGHGAGREIEQFGIPELRDMLVKNWEDRQLCLMGMECGDLRFETSADLNPRRAGRKRDRLPAR